MRPGAHRAYLDTNVIIRFVDDEDSGLRFLFEQAAEGSFELVTSDMTLAEVLVTLLKDGDARLVSVYEALLGGDEALRMVPVSRAVLPRSAKIRASLGNKGADAIHIATALEETCSSFVSSDLRLRLPRELVQTPIERVRDLER